VRGQTLMSGACATAKPAARELGGCLKTRRWEPLRPRILPTIFAAQGQSTAQKSQTLASDPFSVCAASRIIADDFCGAGSAHRSKIADIHV
jgi:hypothetical protein